MTKTLDSYPDILLKQICVIHNSQSKGYYPKTQLLPAVLRYKHRCSSTRGTLLLPRKNLRSVYLRGSHESAPTARMVLHLWSGIERCVLRGLRLLRVSGGPIIIQISSSGARYFRIIKISTITPPIPFNSTWTDFETCLNSQNSRPCSRVCICSERQETRIQCRSTY